MTLRPTRNHGDSDERGAVLVEYALVLAALVLSGVQVVGILSSETTGYQARTASEVGREQVWLPNTTAEPTTSLPSTTASTGPPTTPTTSPSTTTPSTTAPSTTASTVGSSSSISSSTSNPSTTATTVGTTTTEAPTTTTTIFVPPFS